MAEKIMSRILAGISKIPCLFLLSFRIISYLCPVFTSEVEAKSRSGWVGPNLEESVILRFVF